MRFEKYWNGLGSRCEPLRNLSDGVGMRITVVEFKRQLKRAYEAGCRSAASDRKAAEAFGDVGKKDQGLADSFKDIFEGF